MKQEYEDKNQHSERNTGQGKRELINKHKRFFAKYDQLLDRIQIGPHYLKDEKIAALIAREMHRFDGDLYELISYCIMSNHVHLLIDTSIQLPEYIEYFDFGQIEFEPLQNIMKRIKGASAYYANLELGRVGAFWQKESYDHYIRNEHEFNNVIAYILNNPVKAGIVKNWIDYPFSYLKDYPAE
ncbi:MAG: hypothetical protein GY705_10375 [Bacteroidetes bacterium]|nr:hypothetical protein [Bacteroidota bacterium]